MIHDSFGVHPNDIGPLLDTVASQFKLLYRDNPLESLCKKYLSKENWPIIPATFMEHICGDSMIG
jgi:hypothetical protein